MNYRNIVQITLNNFLLQMPFSDSTSEIRDINKSTRNKQIVSDFR